jgi:hypothetical protein
MQLQQGNSGCKLYLLKERDTFFVRKFSASETYNHRLVAQAKKQQSYSNRNDLPFDVPKVLRIDDGYFDMEHFTSISVLEYLLDFGKPASDHIYQTMVDFISTNIASAEYCPLDCSILEQKADSIFENISPESESLLPFSRKDLSEYINSHYGIEIPISSCHGDLTFSNVLIGENNKVVVIDFLDTFYESPLQDIVKIRQDTKYSWWSVLGEEKTISENTRTMIQMQHLDQRFDRTFMKYSFYANLYALFQTMSMLRILPYVGNHLQRKVLVYNSLRDLRGQWT